MIRQQETEKCIDKEQAVAILFEEQLIQLQQQIAQLSNRDAMLETTQELQDRLTEQEKLLQQFQSEQRENQTQLQQIADAIDKVHKQKFVLTETENQCKLELKQLKNAGEMEIQY
ncbi:MAG: hypothetical protein K1W16_04675 [Lachnospiraceae bacterium]